MKLDMAKAYDRIEWHYLRCIMLKLGFNEHLVNLIMKCGAGARAAFAGEDGVVTLGDVAAGGSAHGDDRRRRGETLGCRSRQEREG